MTSAGIPGEAWIVIQERAAQLVNASQSADSVMAEVYRGQLFDALDELEERHGRLPSILTTRADFARESDDPASLWLEAFSTAISLEDGKNRLYVASSLASHYLEQENHAQALHWILEAEKALSFDRSEAGSLREMKAEILAKKIKRRSD